MSSIQCRYTYYVLILAAMWFQRELFESSIGNSKCCFCWSCWALSKERRWLSDVPFTVLFKVCSMGNSGCNGICIYFECNNKKRWHVIQHSILPSFSLRQLNLINLSGVFVSTTLLRVYLWVHHAYSILTLALFFFVPGTNIPQCHRYHVSV